MELNLSPDARVFVRPLDPRDGNEFVEIPGVRDVRITGGEIQRPLLGSRPLEYPERAAGGPCAGCGKAITSGQLYLVDGPYHFGCKEA
jgi:hypothetical protein